MVGGNKHAVRTIGVKGVKNVTKRVLNESRVGAMCASFMPLD